jgi:multidrug resistance efflux pump
MKKFSLPLIILSAAMLVLAACSPAAAQPTVVAAESQPAALITAGRLQPANMLAQSFTIPGMVAEVMVKDGEVVEVGQVLARLNSAPEASLALARAGQEVLSAQQALADLEEQAEVRLSQAKLARIAAEEGLELAQERYDEDETGANQARLEDARVQLKLARQAESRLAAGAGVDPDEKQAIEARLTTAMAAQESAQAAVDAGDLKATLAGTVVDLDLQAGQRVSAGQPVLMVADFSSWVIKTDNLTEVDVVNVQVGQKVNGVLDALPGKTLSGEVTHINRLFEEKRGDVTFTVTAVLSETDPLMRWGMTAAVQFLP